MAETTKQPTIYAAFNDAADAERAAGAIMDHGVKPEQISLIVSEAYHRKQGKLDDEQLDYSHPHTVVREHDQLNTADPFHNEMRDTPIYIDPAPNRHDLGAGQEMLDFSPAQDDYPRRGGGGVNDLSSAPPEALRDYNKNLDKDYNRNYDNDVERENQKEWDREAAARERLDEPDEGLDINRVHKDADTEREVDRTVGPAVYDPERAAKLGLTTTTIEDAGEGAKKGALWGLGVGALAAVAALAIPGYGIVLGGGALAAAAGAMAASAGAGAVAGGVVGYLKDQGVPGHDIPHYQKAVEEGGALLAIHLDPDENRAHVEEVLQKYGAHMTNSYGYAA